MKKLQRAAVLLSLIEAMRQQDSWCGETNIQKACYFLQELTEVPLDLDFVLYKYGPYSFELTDELTALRADSILTLRVRDPRYGPCYAPGELGDLVKSRFAKTIGRFQERVEFVASKLAVRGIAELERLATALYVFLEGKARPELNQRVSRITALKPHITPQAAQEAVRDVDKMLSEFRELVLS